MFRVLLGIAQIRLNVKQPVAITITIKKQDKNIASKNMHMLINGKAILKQHFQFYINTLNPAFQIETTIILKQMKKRAGYVQINLNQSQIDLANQLQKELLKCKDPNGKMLIEFIYMKSDYVFDGNQLVSSDHIELLKISKQKLEVSRKKELVKTQAKKLQEQYQKILSQNKTLSKKLSTLDKQQEQQEKKINQQIKSYEKMNAKAIKQLQLQKRKIAEIVQLINEQGDPRLVEKLQEIIDQMA